MRWASLFVCLALAGIGSPARAHIFGTKSDDYIRITPLAETSDPDAETYAMYEWCQWEVDEETYAIVVHGCEPIGKPGCYYSIETFSRLFREMEGELYLDQKAIPIMEEVANVSLMFMGSGKVAQLSERAAVQYVIPKLPALWSKTQKVVKWSIALIGGFAGWTATDIALGSSERLAGWTVETAMKNKIRTINLSGDPKKSGSAWNEALIFNRFVLSGQGGYNDPVAESTFFNMTSVRNVIDMSIREADPSFCR